MSELTRERLAAAITSVRDAHGVPLAKYRITADELAGELLAELGRQTADPWAPDDAPEPLVVGDPELAAMAAIITAMGPLPHSVRQRIRMWVDERWAATEPPF